LILSQWSTRPGLYGEPSRFDTIPSQPSADGISGGYERWLLVGQIAVLPHTAVVWPGTVLVVNPTRFPMSELLAGQLRQLRELTAMRRASSAPHLTPLDYLE